MYTEWKEDLPRFESITLVGNAIAGAESFELLNLTTIQFINITGCNGVSTFTLIGLNNGK